MAGFKYYKLTITDFRRDGSQVNYANVKEINLLDSNGIDISRLDGANYSANSYYNSNETPEKAFDGNLNTIWHSDWRDSPSYTNWIKISLPESKEAYTLVLTHGNGSYADFPAAFVLEGSDDDLTYTNLLSVEGLTSGWSMGTPREFELIPPYAKKYLIKSNSTLYTIVDNVLSPLSNAELTAQVFLDNGFETIPDTDLFAELINPELLYWHDSENELPNINIIVNGTPPLPQILITDPQDMSHGSIIGINNATAVASEDALFAIAFDEDTTWKMYDGTQWIVTTDETQGMSATTLAAITTEAWAEIATSDSYCYQVKFILPSKESYITSFVINYLN